jgi:hypothetical protein
MLILLLIVVQFDVDSEQTTPSSSIKKAEMGTLVLAVSTTITTITDLVTTYLTFTLSAVA